MYYKPVKQFGSKLRKNKHKAKHSKNKGHKSWKLNKCSDSGLHVFKNLNQKTSYFKFLLSTDIESNPSPPVVDPAKTISAPYTQNNIAVFGTRNVQQCVYQL